MKSQIHVRKIIEQKEMDAAFQIRQTVFVEEQEVDPELEYDEFENTSTHFLAIVEDRAVGTARWRKIPNGVKLERFAVLKEHRNNGVGSALIQAVINDVPNDCRMFLHAQLAAKELYARHGFIPYGDQFEEAGIQHVAMKKEPTSL